MKNWKELPIKTKINFVLAPSIIVIAIVISLLILWRSRNALYDQLERRATAVIRNFASSSVLAVATGDNDYLNKLSERFLEDPDIIYLSVINEKNKKIFEKTKNKVYSRFFDEGVLKNHLRDKGYVRVKNVIFVKEPLEIKFKEGEQELGVGYDLGNRNLGNVFLGISTAKIDSDFRGIFIFSSFMVLLFVLTGIGFSMFALSRIFRPVKEMVYATQKVAKGDLTLRLEVSSYDEIGILADNFSKMLLFLKDVLLRINEIVNSLIEAGNRAEEISNSMREGFINQKRFLEEIEKSIDSINTSAQNIAENTEILNSSAQESSSAMLEMGASVEEVSENMDKLLESVNETTGSVQEMAISIKQVAENVVQLMNAISRTADAVEEIDTKISEIKEYADDMSGSSENMRRNAKEGEDSLMKTTSQIEKIEALTINIGNAMNGLRERLGEINKIVNVIDDIAEQTNLLALNAAIIAAQSGEKGRGFSVVADNIKELSDRTSESTKEIIDLIESIFDEMLKVEKAVDAGSKAVEEGVSLAQETGKLFLKITEGADDSYRKSAEIAEATGEQKKSSENVKEATGVISEMAGQIQRAIDEQAKGSDLIRKAAENMRDVAEFVKSSMEELSKSGKRVAQLIENMSEMVKFIRDSTKEQSGRTNKVTERIYSILKVAEENVDLVGDLKAFFDKALDKSREMNEVTKTFKIRREE